MNPIYAAQAAADDALPNGGVTADFSAETWWLTLIKAGFIVAFLIVSVMMALWVERRGLARMQTRLGPNVNGPLGLLQAVADAGKLIMKEDFWLKGAEKVIYLLAPLIAAFSASRRDSRHKISTLVSLCPPGAAGAGFAAAGDS